MADFFSNLARQVLGAAPEVGPLLPPRFAPWPGIPQPDVAVRPQDPADTPARADAVNFPTPLIDPDGPAAHAPLPTFRQISELRSASGPSGQPGQMPVAQDRPGTADSEQGDVRPDVTTPVRPAVDDTPPHVLPDAPASTPTSSAIQIETDSDTDNALTASRVPRRTRGDRPSEETAPKQHGQAVPHASSLTPASTLPPAPRPTAGQEQSAYSAGLPDSPVGVRRLPRSGQAEPVKTEPLETELIEAKRPKPVKARTDPIKGYAELVEARPKPAEARSELLEARPEPASVPLTVQPAAFVPAPVTRRQAVPGDQPVAPLESRPVPATEPDLPVSTQGRAIPATPVSDVTTGSLEPVPPAGRAVPGWREPVIVPAPEPAPGEMGSPTLAEGKVSLRPPSARPTTGAPEPATTVRVTIGRVVVRASPAAERPPSRRVELPRPSLSLEEYLQGRQGGER